MAIATPEQPNQNQPSTANAQAMLAEAQDMLRQVRDENAQRRVTEQKAKEAAAKALADAGNFQALFELEQKKTAELESLRPLAEQYKEIEAATVAEIAAIATTLPLYAQTALANMTSLKAKREFLAQHQTSKPQQPERAAPIPAANAAPAPVDFTSSMTSVAAVREAQERDPKGFVEHFQRLLSGNSRKTTLERINEAHSKG